MMSIDEVFVEFLEVIINQILYKRGMYPQQIFKRQKVRISSNYKFAVLHQIFTDSLKFPNKFHPFTYRSIACQFLSIFTHHYKTISKVVFSNVWIY